MVKIRSRKVKPIFLLALLLSLVMLSKGVTDNDNFIIFTEDIGGFPVPATDGNTYFIGTNISKVSLSSRIVSNVIEIYSSDLATKINFDGGALTGDQSVLVVHPVGGGGPNCFELVTITTSDMQLRQDNCLKILSDNIFGPKIYMIKRDPSNNTIFYGVGYHIDYIANVDTGIVIQFQVLDTYAISMLNFKKVNSSFKTTGTTKGWNSLDFDSTATNIALSGLLKSGSTTYCSVLSISKSLSKFNWMKYFKVKSTSSLVLTYKEVKSYYDSSTNSLISVVFSSNSYSTYYTLINIFSLSMTDGSTNWSNQFIDYGSANFATIRSVINPFYGELSLYFSDSNYKYYSIQSISLKNGTMLTNMQVEIFKHYQLDNIVVFPNQTSGTSSSDLLICPITGYIMKMNTRKANLDIIDKTSLFRPLYSINYNNFTLPTTSPVDLEAVSYSPASDFFYSETSYEIESLAYTYKKGSIPTLQLATDMMIYFSNTTDNVSVPNNSEFTLNQAHTKDNLMDAYISLTFQLFNITNLSTPLGSDAYELIRSGNTYKVKIKNIKSGTFYAKATASQGGFYTYYDFTLVVRCTNNCDLCSNIDTCDVCSSGYVLDYQSQCQSTNASMIDSNVVQGLVASAMLSILALGALQMQINSNLWVFVNTLQILRTILLLKINLPLSVRDMINSSTALSTFDFGVTNKVVPDPSSSIQIDQIMNGDNVLAQYFNDYGIQSYRFMEFVESLFFDTLCLFLN